MSLTRGIYCPNLTFFHDDESESVDYKTCVSHALYLATAGVKGLVLQGSTGEAVALTVVEKSSIIAAVRQGLDENGYQHCPIIAGIGGQSLQESLTLARSAHSAGAYCGLAISPSFFSMHMTEDILEAYFRELADKSPMPIMVYNFPGVTNGINVSSNLLRRLSHHPNIIGTKLTCNTMSKIQALHPQSMDGTFHVLTGSSEFLGAARTAGAMGAITGMANLFPYTMVKLYDLLDANGDGAEILRIQSIVTQFEGIMMKAFIPGNRAVLRLLNRPAGHSRKPLPDATQAEMTFYRDEMIPMQKEELRWMEQAL